MREDLCVQFIHSSEMQVQQNTSDNTVKSHFKALGLYNFKGGLGWAYKRGGVGKGGL